MYIKCVWLNNYLILINHEKITEKKRVHVLSSSCILKSFQLTLLWKKLKKKLFISLVSNFINPYTHIKTNYVHF